MAKQKHAGKEFEKLGKTIQKTAKEIGLLAVPNRLKLFINGKPGRRWWFVDKQKLVLISAEYGLVDSEAMEFLAKGQKNK